MVGGPAGAVLWAAAGRDWEVGAAAGAAAARGAAAVAVADGALDALLVKGAALGAPVGPPGGSVGSLMVGAVDGLGGKLMRTVSFLGWTLPVSFLTGGTAPVGAPGIFCGISAII